MPLVIGRRVGESFTIHTESPVDVVLDAATRDEAVVVLRRGGQAVSVRVVRPGEPVSPVPGVEVQFIDGKPGAKSGRGKASLRVVAPGLRITRPPSRPKRGAGRAGRLPTCSP